MVDHSGRHQRSRDLHRYLPTYHQPHHSFGTIESLSHQSLHQFFVFGSSLISYWFNDYKFLLFTYSTLKGYVKQTLEEFFQVFQYSAIHLAIIFKKSI